MRNIIYILIFLISQSFALTGQTLIRYNNYWDNVYNINPASINGSYLSSISMGIQKQWINFDGAPTTVSTTGTIYFEEIATQLGVKAFVEKKGFTSSLDFDFSYTNSFSISDFWNLNLGVAISYQNLSYDLSKIVLPYNESPDIYDRLHSTNHINSDFGFEFNDQNWKIGGSSQNLLSLFREENDVHFNTNLLYALYRQTSSDYINYGYGVSAFQYDNIFLMEFNFSTFIKKNRDSNPVQIGTFFRTWREIGLNLGFELDRFKVSYSCSYNFGKILKSSLGTHEIILTYNFNKFHRCRNCW